TRLSWRSGAVGITRDRRANHTAPNDVLPKGRRRAPVLLHDHDLRHAARRDARGASHRVLVSSGRSDDNQMPRAVRFVKGAVRQGVTPYDDLNLALPRLVAA